MTTDRLAALIAVAYNDWEGSTDSGLTMEEYIAARLRAAGVHDISDVDEAYREGVADGRLAQNFRERYDALRAAAQAVIALDPFDYEEGRCYWCGGGWEDVPGPRGGKRPLTHTGRHADDCPFAALRAAYRDDPVGTFNVIVAVLNEHGWDARPVAPDAQAVRVLGHPLEDVIRWKAEYDMRHPAPPASVPADEYDYVADDLAFDAAREDRMSR